jgi:hypothetical protein
MGVSEAANGLWLRGSNLRTAATNPDRSMHRQHSSAAFTASATLNLCTAAA